MFSFTRPLRRGPTSLPKTLNSLMVGGATCLMRWIYIHWFVDYVDLAEPEREGTTEEVVDAHDHAHVEVSENNSVNVIKVQKPT